MTIAVGTTVTIKTTVLTGTVTGAVIDDSGNYQVKVQYNDAGGVAQERYFLESELTV